mmetsp:Transcript_120726/g.341401  ORF Transcript_120726/g.341401 Transcript_120726/m.341401 type:complete len:328 (+) Transcript_120726:234-1217(+)
MACRSAPALVPRWPPCSAMPSRTPATSSSSAAPLGRTWAATAQTSGCISCCRRSSTTASPRAFFPRPSWMRSSRRPSATLSAGISTLPWASTATMRCTWRAWMPGRAPLRTLATRRSATARSKSMMALRIRNQFRSDHPRRSASHRQHWIPPVITSSTARHLQSHRPTAARPEPTWTIARSRPTPWSSPASSCSGAASSSSGSAAGRASKSARLRRGRQVGRRRSAIRCSASRRRGQKAPLGPTPIRSWGGTRLPWATPAAAVVLPLRDCGWRLRRLRAQRLWQSSSACGVTWTCLWPRGGNSSRSFSSSTTPTRIPRRTPVRCFRQ